MSQRFREFHFSGAKDVIFSKPNGDDSGHLI